MRLRSRIVNCSPCANESEKRRLWPTIRTVVRVEHEINHRRQRPKRNRGSGLPNRNPGVMAGVFICPLDCRLRVSLPSPPAGQASAGEHQAGKSSAADRTGDWTLSTVTGLK